MIYILLFFLMVAFTLHLLWWLACALFRFFVIAWTSYGIYKLIKDKIDKKRIERIAEKQHEKHKKEMEEAKERIAKLAEEERKKKHW